MGIKSNYTRQLRDS